MGPVLVSGTDPSYQVPAFGLIPAGVEAAEPRKSGGEEIGASWKATPLELTWLWVSKPFWEPILVAREFTTQFRTYFSGWIGMFTGGTIWILTHGHRKMCLRLTRYVAKRSDIFNIRVATNG